MTNLFTLHTETASPISRRTEHNYLPFAPEGGVDSILTRWKTIVAHLPEHPAIVTDQQALTYQQLDQRAAQIARAILAVGSPSPLVALLFAQGSNPIVAMIGILKADLAYVALNATIPLAQLRAQWADSCATVIVTDQEHLSLAQELAGQGQQLINIDAPMRSDELPLPTAGKVDEALLALYYTSGSTGEPKGVMIPHGYVMNDARRSAFSYEFHFADRIALLYEWSYAIGGVHLIFSPLLNGATIYLSDTIHQNSTTLPQWVAQQQITILHIPIPLFRHLAYDDSIAAVDMGEQLAMIVLGGLSLQWCDVAAFVKRFGCTQAQIEFGYGMTEAGRVAMQWLCLSDVYSTGKSIPAGYATMNNELLIVDEHGQPLPPNTIGEVVLCSPFLALGYWQKLAETAQRFHTDQSGKQRFLTGDIGRMGIDGKLEILGRKDAMVKVRGYRLMLSAIETALRQLDTVTDAAVTAPEFPGGERRIVAYLRTTQPRPEQRLLYQHLQDKLAHYEIPSHFIFLNELPRTISGKIDYQALPQPKQGRSDELPFVPPVTPLEQALAALWMELLGTDEVSIEDNFFALGGHSLHAMTLMTQLEQKYGARLGIHAFFAEPTIAHLAHLLSGETASSTAATLYDTSSLSETQTAVIRAVHTELADMTRPQNWQKLVFPDPGSRRHRAIQALLQRLPFALTIRLLQQFAQTLSRGQAWYAKEMALTQRFLATIGDTHEWEAVRAQSLFYNWLYQYRLIAARQLPYTLPPEGIALLNGAQAKGKGVILTAFHTVAITPLDLAAWQPVVFVGGLQNVLAYYRINDALIANNLFSEQLDNARLALNAGGIVHISPDGHQGYSQGIVIDFHGRRRPFRRSFAELALTTGATVFTLVRSLDPTGKLQINLLGPLDPGPAAMPHAERVERLVAQYVEFLGRMWRETPWLVPWYQMERHLAYPPGEGGSD